MIHPEGNSNKNSTVGTFQYACDRSASYMNIEWSYLLVLCHIPFPFLVTSSLSLGGVTSNSSQPESSCQVLTGSPNNTQEQNQKQPSGNITSMM